MTTSMYCIHDLSVLMHAGARQPTHSTQPLTAACRAARQPGAADDGPDDGPAEQCAGLHGWVPPPFLHGMISHECMYASVIIAPIVRSDGLPMAL